MKKIFFFSGILTLALTLLFSLSVHAEDRYVSDTIYIVVRADKDPNSSIVQQSLASGTKLGFIREELGADNKNWSLVTTPQGKEGWVRSQNLMNHPTAALRLAAIPGAEQNAASIQTENTSLKEQLEKLQTEHQQLLADTEDMRQAATTAINLDEDNQRMHKEFQLLQTRADVLQAENDQLRDSDRFNHWVYGGGLVLGGVVLSFILQGLGRRKRKSEWR